MLADACVYGVVLRSYLGLRVSVMANAAVHGSVVPACLRPWEFYYCALLPRACDLYLFAHGESGSRPCVELCAYVCVSVGVVVRSLVICMCRAGLWAFMELLLAVCFLFWQLRGRSEVPCGFLVQT
jgi:hypothetical protein